MRPLLAPALCAALAPAGAYAEAASAGAGEAAGGASEPAPPWGKRRATLGLGVGVNISSSLTVVAPGLRGGYYVANGLELGVEVELGALLWSAADYTAHPGLSTRAPGLAVRATPTLRWVFLRQQGFSPYVLAGVGPTVWNHDGGVAGHWVAAPGALIHLGGRVFLDLAIRFSSTFPGARCHRAFTVAAGEVPGYCGFQFGPRLGVAFMF